MSKRAFDFVAAGLGLLLLSPLFLVIAIIIRVHDGGPVFYRARRVGRGGSLIEVLKFRTMVVGADRTGSAVTTSGDTRVTAVGRWLRQLKMDELPQLINVLRGEMSLVGPRPEDPTYVALYSPDQRRVLEVLPGITSAASLVYRNESELLSGPDWERVYRELVLPRKLEIELEYLAHRSLWTDLQLILRTLIAVTR